MQNQNLRRLPLEGAINVRDLGGWACPGGATRWHAFLRSAGTQRLTDADIDTLKAYGVTDTIDLRSGHEAKQSPSRLAAADGVQGHNVPMLDKIMSGGGTIPKSLGDLYVALLDTGAEDFATIFRIFAAARGAVLFHCAVGKDRTGMTAMLLLKLAGVADADIVADYAVSEIYLQSFVEAHMAEFESTGVSRELLQSAPENMWRALAHLEKRHGGAEKYLLAAGLTPEELGRVKAKLV